MHTRETEVGAASVRHIACAAALVCLTGCVTALFTQDGSAPVAPAASRHNGSAETQTADSSRSKRIVAVRAGTVVLPVVKKLAPKRARQSITLDQFMTILVAGTMSLLVPAFVWLWRQIDDANFGHELDGLRRNARAWLRSFDALEVTERQLLERLGLTVEPVLVQREQILSIERHRAR